MGLEEYKGVYIYAQQVDNKLSDIAFELVGKAKELAADLNTEVTAVLLGSNVKALATELGEYGADKVIVVDNPALETYRTEPYAQALVSVINEYKPEIMLVGATAIGRDLGPTVSARVKTGLTADCTKLEIGDFPINAMPGQEQKHNQLLMTRPAFGGNTIATIACPDNRPQMATVRPCVMQKLPKEAGRVISNWLCFCSSSLPGTALIGKSPISSFVQSAVSPVATLADTVGPRSRPIAVAPTNIISGLYSLMTAARACAYGSVRYVSSSGLSTTITLSAPYSPNSSVKPFTFDPRRTAVTLRFLTLLRQLEM